MIKAIRKLHVAADASPNHTWQGCAAEINVKANLQAVNKKTSELASSIDHPGPQASYFMGQSGKVQ